MAISEFQPHVRTVLASFLFVDLVGFSKVSAAEQHAFKVALIDVLHRNLAILAPQDYRLRDTGDGALISFLNNPEHALYMALAIAHDCGRMAPEDGLTLQNLRTGINLGTVKESLDVESRPNFVGDGINAAQRIMDFAQPGQVTASRSFMEAMALLDFAYSALFVHLGARADKHGRQHELFAVSPNENVLGHLRRGLAVPGEGAASLAVTASAPPQAVDRVIDEVAAPVMTVPPLPARAPAAEATGRPARALFLWLMLGAVAVAGAGVLAGRFLHGGAGDAAARAAQVPAAATPPGVPNASNVPTAPTAPTARSVPTVPAAAAVQAVSSAPAAALPSSTAVSVPSPSAPPPAPVAPAVGTAASVPAPASPGLTEGAHLKSVPPVRPARPLAAKADPALKTPRATEPSLSPSPSPSLPAERAAPSRADPRCSRIMQKAGVGEPLSSEEKKELAHSC